MIIKNRNSIEQGIANINLEGLSISKDLKALINEELKKGTFDTTHIFKKIIQRHHCDHSLSR